MSDDQRPDTPGCHAQHTPSVFRRRRRRAVERAVLEAVLPLLVVLAGAVIVGSGPVDYLSYGWLAEILATMVAVVTVPLFVGRLTLGSRVSVVLTPDGIDSGPPPGRIPWPDVISLRTISHQADRHILLTRHVQPDRHGGPRLHLRA